MEYSFRLESFEGPLDLLLHLIEKNKVDIYDIPISLITEQYLQAIADMPEKDLEEMSEFLLMASTLLDIKAKMLLPKDEEAPEEGDPRAELVARLLEYRKYKEERQTVELLGDERGIFTLRMRRQILYEGVSAVEDQRFVGRQFVLGKAAKKDGEEAEGEAR